MGGCAANSYKNDVWHTSDGKNWTQATASAGWDKRISHGAIVYNNKMWVIGGGKYGVTSFDCYNDVWNSTDGKNWTKVTGSAGWKPRAGHTVEIYDNKMWVIGGGIPYTSTRYNDVWYSTDGKNWTCATPSAQWSKRERHSSAVYDGKIWVIGGDAGNKLNDVWYYKGATSINIDNKKYHDKVSFSVLSGNLNNTHIALTIKNPMVARVSIYNGFGKEIASLCNKHFPVGDHSIIWNKKDYSGKIVPVSIYFVRLTISNYTQTRKLVLLK